MRVIAGVARGRPLRAPRSADTRPTSDLIKGVIFSMLEAEAYKRGFEPDEEGVMAAAQAWPSVLDLFAGSGALGIEALSRGAQHAVFVEDKADAAAAIQANLRATRLEERAIVYRQTVAGALQRLRERADLVFLDPPYGADDATRGAIEALERAPLLSPSSVVVLEQAASSEPPGGIGPLHVRSTRTHGRTRVSVYGS